MRTRSPRPRPLDVPGEALELYRSSDVVDLHVDSFIWARILRYDLTKHHRRKPLGRYFLGQVDFPRAIAAGVTGAMWSITTNPFRSADVRQRAFNANLEQLRATIDDAEGVELVRTVAEYRAARAAGRHGAFLAVQGGHALRYPADVSDDLVRITLVHQTSSVLGETSTPSRRFARTRGLTRAGHRFVEACDEHRILVDLAHASPECFWDVVAMHDAERPLIVTHTGIAGVHPSWRNLDDDQLRAVADTGGCVGVMLHGPFLTDGTATTETVADHLDHIVRVAGDDVPAIGTDLDGMIVSPADLADHRQFPRLVAELLSRGWTHDQVRKALGGNALRTIELARG